jgi:hypothetical protein
MKVLELTFQLMLVLIFVGDNYFSPESDNTIENYFNSLETKFDTQSFRVILLGDFNVPG